MQKFERAHFEVKEYDESQHYGKFVFEPLERGFGTTIGNALRRVLLSSLPGAAVFSIKVDGVYHEFTSIPGIVEDVTAIILNIKTLVMSIQDDEIYTLRISKQGPGAVTTLVPHHLQKTAFSRFGLLHFGQFIVIFIYQFSTSAFAFLKLKFTCFLVV